jgi:hypothetical protein
MILRETGLTALSSMRFEEARGLAMFVARNRRSGADSL